ncbi:hypothetical protein [Candidatus Berkiella aquae]|uniref:SnoaL-like domain protein n=1 Tax=Candidatus Berkiella aquae TaxID=295108 RepID=A0A0Q9YY15_9GAMM|nr:hypothetical protein [Candidatus Berkiella aquae]MCS5711977.1 hypothetical protein [Candidatus Berkiella aquae]
MFKKMRKLFTMMGAIMLLSTTIEAKASELQVVKDTYKWFNQISSEKRMAFSQNDVAKYFSSDAQMITNAKLACEGIQGHYDHFLELNNHYKILHVDIDAMDLQQAGERVYLNFVMNAKDWNNLESKIHVMGYMIVKNERIVSFNELFFHEVV